MLARRLRRRPNIKTTLGKCLVLAVTALGEGLVVTGNKVFNYAYRHFPG